MAAAVPTADAGGRRQAELVQELRRGAARRRARDLLPARRRRVQLRRRAVALALGPPALVVLALCWELAMPSARRACASADASRSRGAASGPRARARLRPGPRAARGAARPRAPALLRERGGVGDVPRPRLPARPRGRAASARRTQYAYLIYPHKPIVAYLPQSGAIINEYCVAFRPRGRWRPPARLPDADDVLAKWMLLDRRRARAARAGEHAHARAPDRSRAGRSDLARLRRGSATRRSAAPWRRGAMRRVPRDGASRDSRRRARARRAR